MKYDDIQYAVSHVYTPPTRFMAIISVISGRRHNLINNKSLNGQHTARKQRIIIGVVPEKAKWPLPKSPPKIQLKKHLMALD